MEHEAETTEQPDAGLERILEFLQQTRGFDFTAYKHTSLMRRVRKRMQVVGIGDFDTYLDHLQVHPNEFAELFNTILINVTSFFRDPEVWKTLGEQTLPELTDRTTGPIRVWSAGCASGQEPYSAAMLLADRLGMDAYRERVKIYATDADEQALGEARRAVYTAKHVSDVPPAFLEKYFTRNGGDLYTIDRELRRSVIFGRHDLVQDAPISRVDLLLCRNTLMYFNADVQSRIMARFYFSINAAGYLVLGRAEMLFSYASMFQAVDLKRRIFKAARKVARDRVLLLSTPGGREEPMPEHSHARLRDLAFQASPDPELVLEPGGNLVAINDAARRTFNIGDADLGSPLQDLEVSYRPVELRAIVDRARGERREVALNNVASDEGNGRRRFFDVLVVPLFDEQRGLVGMRIRYTDVTPMKTLQEELTQSKQELETAYEELQSTNEELETTNEELQSTVEELETTNEELQSTNEELETMNEELQSTNEELHTMNDELRSRSTELNATNTFLETVFTSLRAAVVVLNRDFTVHVWNAGAMDMWGLRPEEVQGNSFFTLDIGLPVGELHQPIRDVLQGAAHRDVTLAATNRKGRAIQCRVTITPLVEREPPVSGVILLMEDTATVWRSRAHSAPLSSGSSGPVTVVATSSGTV